MAQEVDQGFSLAKAVFDHMTDGVILVDAQRRIRAINPAAERMVGPWAEDIAGRVHCSTYLECRDSKGQRVCHRSCPLLSGIENEPVHIFEVTIRGAGGERRPVTVSAAIIPVDPAHQDHLIALSLRDISEQRRLELELENRRLYTELLYDLSCRLASITGFNEGLATVLDQVRDVLSVDVAAWLELDPGGEFLHYRTVSGSPAYRFPARIRLAGVYEVPMAERRTHVAMEPAADTATQSGLILTAGRVRAVAVTPLLGRTRLLGALMVAANSARNFTPDQLSLLEAVAGQVAVAVENVALLHEMEGEAASQERQRLAAEIHESLAHTLNAITQQAKDLPTLLAANQVQEAMPIVQTVIATVNQALQEVRQAVIELRSNPPRATRSEPHAGASGR